MSELNKLCEDKDTYINFYKYLDTASLTNSLLPKITTNALKEYNDKIIKSLINDYFIIESIGMK